MATINGGNHQKLTYIKPNIFRKFLCYLNLHKVVQDGICMWVCEYCSYCTTGSVLMDGILDGLEKLREKQIANESTRRS